MTICKNYYNRDENGGLDFTTHATIAALTSKEMEVLGEINEKCLQIERDPENEDRWVIDGPHYSQDLDVYLMAASSLVARGLLVEHLTTACDGYPEVYWLGLSPKGVEVLAELYNLGRFHREMEDYRAHVRKVGLDPVHSALTLYTQKMIKLTEMAECPALSERAVTHMREEIGLCREVVACLRAATDSQSRGRSISLRRPLGFAFGRRPARETWALSARVYAEFGAEYGTSRAV